MENALNERNIQCVELFVARYFTERGAEAASSQEIIAWVKQKGHESGVWGIRKSEIKEARKRLGIKSKSEDGEYFWIWENEKSPETIWVEKSREVLGP